MHRDIKIAADRGGNGLVTITVAEGPFCTLDDNCKAARKAFIGFLYKVAPWQITLAETAKATSEGKSDGI